jgi:RNA polymerase sigma-70 factor (ECF subfamily)
MAPGDAYVAELHERARAAYPDIAVDQPTFAAELARRVGTEASMEQLERTRIDHVYLAIACMAGDARAVERVEAEFFGEVDWSARRLRATRDQTDEVRSQLGRILFVSEPGREAGLAAYSGRGDLGSYIRVIATRELVRVISKGRREVAVADSSLFDQLSPVSEPELRYLRERYRGDVDTALRAALAGLSEESRALLRYSVIDGWTIDRIAALYGIHRSTAARRVTGARDELGDAIRNELATRLAVSTDEVDSVVRLVQSRVDVSLARLLG